MHRIPSQLVDTLSFTDTDNISTIPNHKRVLNITNCDTIALILDFLTSKHEIFPENLFMLIFNVKEPKKWIFDRQKVQKLSESLKHSKLDRIFVFQSRFRTTKFLCKHKTQIPLTKIELNRGVHEDEFMVQLATSEFLFKAIILTGIENAVCGRYETSFLDISVNIERHFMSLKLIDYAIINFDSLTFKFLQLFGTNLSIKNENGDKMLETAVKCGNFEAFLELLGTNFEYLMEIHEPTGYNLLMLAAENGNAEILDFLLNLKIFDVNFEVDGKTALKLAVENEKYEAILMLLENDAKYDEEFVRKFKEMQEVEMKCEIEENSEIFIKVGHENEENFQNFDENESKIESDNKMDKSNENDRIDEDESQVLYELILELVESGQKFDKINEETECELQNNQVEDITEKEEESTNIEEFPDKIDTESAENQEASSESTEKSSNFQQNLQKYHETSFQSNSSPKNCQVVNKKLETKQKITDFLKNIENLHKITKNLNKMMEIEEIVAKYPQNCHFFDVRGRSVLAEVLKYAEIYVSDDKIEEITDNEEDTEIFEEISMKSDENIENGAKKSETEEVGTKINENSTEKDESLTESNKNLSENTESPTKTLKNLTKTPKNPPNIQQNSIKDVKLTKISTFIEFLLLKGLRIGLNEEFDQKPQQTTQNNPFFCEYFHRVLSMCSNVNCNNELLINTMKQLNDVPETKILLEIIGAFDDVRIILDLSDENFSFNEKLCEKFIKYCKIYGNVEEKFDENQENMEDSDEKFESPTKKLKLSHENSENYRFMMDNNSKATFSAIFKEKLSFFSRNSFKNQKLRKLNQKFFKFLFIDGKFDQNALNFNFNFENQSFSSKSDDSSSEFSFCSEISKETCESSQKSVNYSSRASTSSFEVLERELDELESLRSINSASSFENLEKCSNFDDLMDDICEDFDKISFKSQKVNERAENFDENSVKSENDDKNSVKSQNFDAISLNSEDLWDNVPVIEAQSKNLKENDENFSRFNENLRNFTEDSETASKYSEISSKFSEVPSNYSQNSSKYSKQASNSKLKSNSELFGQFLEKFSSNFISNVFKFVIIQIFNNNFLPYHQNDQISAGKLEEITKELQKSFNNNKIDEKIIKNVFENSSIQHWKGNLITCVPKICAIYAKNATKLENCQKSYQNLFNFYANLIKDFENHLKMAKLAKKIDKINKISGIKDKIVQVERSFKWQSAKKFEMLKVFEKNEDLEFCLLEFSEQFEENSEKLMKNSKNFTKNSRKSSKIFFTNSPFLTMLQIYQVKPQNSLIFANIESFENENFTKELESMLENAYLIIPVYKNCKISNKMKNLSIFKEFNDRILFIVESNDAFGDKLTNLTEKLMKIETFSSENVKKYSEKLENVFGKYFGETKTVENLHKKLKNLEFLKIVLKNLKKLDRFVEILEEIESAVEKEASLAKTPEKVKENLNFSIEILKNSSNTENIQKCSKNPVNVDAKCQNILGNPQYLQQLSSFNQNLVMYSKENESLEKNEQDSNKNNRSFDEEAQCSKNSSEPVKKMFKNAKNSPKRSLSSQEITKSTKNSSKIQQITSDFFKKHEKFFKLKSNLKFLSQNFNEIFKDFPKVFHIFSDFEPKTKDFLFNSTVDFQGTSIKLSDVINSKIAKILDDIPIDDLADPSKTLNICKNLVSYDKFYYERRFVDRDIKSDCQLEFFTKCEDPIVNFEDLLCKKVILLCDEPGMGKSTTLKQLQFRFKKIFPSNLIIYLDLKLHNSTYEEFKDVESWNFNLFTKFFTKVESFSKFESKLFHRHLTTERIVFLIDGVDELTKKHKDFVINFTINLCVKSHCRLWIGMRPYCIVEFRSAFSIFAYHLEPIDQEKFLEKFIKLKKLPENEVEILRKFFKAFTAFKDQKSYDNPLSIRIVLDVYDQLIAGAGIYTIYETYVWKKLGKFDKNRENVQVPVGSAENSSQFNPFKKFLKVLRKHQHLAMKQFNKYSNRFDHLFIMWILITDDEVFELSSNEIIYGSSVNDVIFMHQTFYEFFVANFVINQIFDYPEQKLHQERLETVHGLFLYILSQKNLQVIGQFIDSYIKDNEEKLLKENNENLMLYFRYRLINDGRWLDLNYFDVNIYDLIVSDFLNIAKFIIKIFKNEFEIAQIFKKISKNKPTVFSEIFQNSFSSQKFIDILSIFASTFDEKQTKLLFTYVLFSESDNNSFNDTRRPRDVLCNRTFTRILISLEYQDMRKFLKFLSHIFTENELEIFINWPFIEDSNNIDENMEDSDDCEIVDENPCGSNSNNDNSKVLGNKESGNEEIEPNASGSVNVSPNQSGSENISPNSVVFLASSQNILDSKVLGPNADVFGPNFMNSDNLGPIPGTSSNSSANSNFTEVLEPNKVCSENLTQNPVSSSILTPILLASAYLNPDFGVFEELGSNSSNFDNLSPNKHDAEETGPNPTVVSPNTVDSINLSLNTVTSDNLTLNPVNSSNLSSNSSCLEVLEPNAVDSANLIVNLVTAGKIRVNTVGSTNLTPNLGGFEEIRPGPSGYNNLSPNRSNSKGNGTNSGFPVNLSSNPNDFEVLSLNTASSDNLGLNSVESTNLSSNSSSIEILYDDQVECEKISSNQVDCDNLTQNPVSSDNLNPNSDNSLNLTQNRVVSKVSSNISKISTQNNTGFDLLTFIRNLSTSPVNIMKYIAKNEKNFNIPEYTMYHFKHFFKKFMNISLKISVFEDFLNSLTFLALGKREEYKFNENFAAVNVVIEISSRKDIRQILKAEKFKISSKILTCVCSDIESQEFKILMNLLSDYLTEFEVYNLIRRHCSVKNDFFMACYRQKDNHVKIFWQFLENNMLKKDLKKFLIHKHSYIAFQTIHYAFQIPNFPYRKYFDDQEFKDMLNMKNEANETIFFMIYKQNNQTSEIFWKFVLEIFSINELVSLMSCRNQRGYAMFHVSSSFIENYTFLDSQPQELRKFVKMNFNRIPFEKFNENSEDGLAEMPDNFPEIDDIELYLI